ncbi:6-pyruvoyl trahydropterin synthase family protein [Arsenicibacter rosenii]|uniref:6-pyruvoyl trahydropterin synthase family protein n=1 Tax=Arsenicibacter rosenii TaxID=1750698 RepID=UPI000A69DC0F|nr:6-carboxytetrahydropterin synthase [Arsenicibacter rosenii]
MIEPNQADTTGYLKPFADAAEHTPFAADSRPRVAVFRKEHFNAAHRLNNPNWSDEKNERVYGKCNNYNYHGHNYDLILQVTGPVDPETGYVIDMKVLSDISKTFVLDRFDHKNLNLDTEEFKDLNPSAENIAIVIYQILREQLDPSLDLKIRLYETERNFVEYPAA